MRLYSMGVKQPRPIILAVKYFQPYNTLFCLNADAQL
jgi:hypothetical protein